MKFFSALRTRLSGMPAVDRSLLIFMVILLAQSAYGFFFQAVGQAASHIDVIVRTSAAAIFGYFLSANFASCTASAPQTPVSTSAHILPTADNENNRVMLKHPIGFGEHESNLESGGAQSDGGNEAAATCSLQIAVATGIGLFCLLALILLRNASQWFPSLAESDAIAATIVQFRDFVSGCVGFLIGCPSRASRQTP